MPLKLMYITNDPAVALIAEKYGVDRIWVDLETLGKEKRQHNMNTVKSKHGIQDIFNISNLLTRSEMLVRINPINDSSEKEINQVIDAGADIIMLPMWKKSEEVKEFIEIVKGRVKTTLLLETKEAVDCLDDVLKSGGFDEVHIGLNDLHLSYGLNFMFELISNKTVENISFKLKKANVPFGFGGISKLGDGLLPAEKIIVEHYRVGSTRAILSRSFCDTAKEKNLEKIENIFKTNMKLLRSLENKISEFDTDDFDRNFDEIKLIVNGIVKEMKCVNK